MIRFASIVVGLVLAQYAVAQTAMEKAEQRIAQLVAPGSKVGALSATPIAWKPGRAVEALDVPITPLVVAPPRLLPALLKDVQPRSAPEGTPLVAFRDESQGPKQVELPTKPLIKLPSIDMNTPLPLPTLARPMVDRASLGEPAFEASLDAAMKRITPTRERPVPFVPYNLPDPFEHVRYGQLRNPPEESATPPVLPLIRPSK